MIHISLPRAPRLDTCPRKAQIHSCSYAHAWYRNLIGQTVEIEFIDSDGYWSREQDDVYHCINVINPKDATLLPLES